MHSCLGEVEKIFGPHYVLIQRRGPAIANSTELLYLSIHIMYMFYYKSCFGIKENLVIFGYIQENAGKVSLSAGSFPSHFCRNHLFPALSVEGWPI
jgi:hypothetical protein